MRPFGSPALKHEAVHVSPIVRPAEKPSGCAYMVPIMKRITLTIDIEPDGSGLSWTLNDWRGQVSAGASSDTAENLMALWGDDIVHVLGEAPYRGGGDLAALLMGDE